MASSKTWGPGPRAIATIALCAFLPVSLSGCFGRFELVRKTYDFNKQVSPDKWIQWFCFLVITIIPIYGFAALVDTVLLNSMEFWTGTNPALAGTQRTFRGENGEVAVVSYGLDGTMDLWITKTDGSEQFVRLARDSNSILAVDGDGNRLARVGDLNGRPALLPD